jgi:hypothetical protein
MQQQECTFQPKCQCRQTTVPTSILLQDAYKRVNNKQRQLAQVMESCGNNIMLVTMSPQLNRRATPDPVYPAGVCL